MGPVDGHRIDVHHNQSSNRSLKNVDLCPAITELSAQREQTYQSARSPRPCRRQTAPPASACSRSKWQSCFQTWAGVSQAGHPGHADAFALSPIATPQATDSQMRRFAASVRVLTPTPDGPVNPLRPAARTSAARCPNGSDRCARRTTSGSRSDRRRNQNRSSPNLCVACQPSWTTR